MAKDNIFKRIKAGKVDDIKSFVEMHPECLKEKASWWGDHDTVLTYALAHLKEEALNDVVEYLLRLGADPNATNKQGYSPVHIAARKNKASILPMLVDAGAELELKCNRYHATPLHWAAYKGCNEAFKQLLLLGADREARIASGRTIIGLSSNSTIREYNKDVFPLSTLEMDALFDVNSPLEQPLSSLTGAFVKESKYMISITEKAQHSNLQIKTLYDFDNETITVITKDDDGVSNSQQSFKQAASPKLLTKATAFYESAAQSLETGIKTSSISAKVERII